MSDCAHDRGYRIAHGRVYCGTCSYNSWLPRAWLKGQESIDHGEVKPSTAASVLGMLCPTSNFMAGNRLMILAEERLFLKNASGIFNINFS